MQLKQQHMAETKRMMEDSESEMDRAKPKHRTTGSLGALSTIMTAAAAVVIISLPPRSPPPEMIDEDEIIIIRADLSFALLLLLM